MSKLIYLMLFPFILFCQTRSGIIEGRIVDDNTKEGLYGANINLLNTNIGVATDVNGFYEIKNVPLGNYILQCNYITYSTKIDTIELNMNQNRITKNYDLKYIGIPEVEYEKDITLSGYCTLSFEYSGITPCDSIKALWLEYDESFYKIYQDLMNDMGINKLAGGSVYNPIQVFCILKGSLSKIGKYGHLGCFEYQFKVKEIVSMSKPSSEDCKK